MRILVKRKRWFRQKPRRWTSKITLRNGRVLYAKNFGIKAFPIY